MSSRTLLKWSAFLCTELCCAIAVVSKELAGKSDSGLQELEHQMVQLTQQVNTGQHSVRVLELESERRLAEERIAELESQLAAASVSGLPGTHTMLCKG